MVSLGRRQWGCLAAAGWLCTFAAQSAVSETQKVRLGLSMRNSMNQLPLMLADQLGYFRQAGIALEWQEFDTDAQVHQALMAGLLDVACGTFDQVLDLNAQGQKVKAFVLQGRTPQISLGIAMRHLASYQSLADLKRFKIGIADVSSPTAAMAQLWCLKGGLNPRDMQWVEVGRMHAAMDQLRSGAVDALCHFDPVMSWLEYRSDLRVVAETRTLQGAQQWLDGACAASCLLAKTDFLQLKPTLVQGLADGVVRALKWLMTAGPTDLLKTIPPQAWIGDRAFYLGTVDKLRESYCPDGWFGEDLVQAAGRSRAWRLGLPRPQATDRSILQAAYTNDAVQKSKKRFPI